jgi:hypothetical protein
MAVTAGSVCMCTHVLCFERGGTSLFLSSDWRRVNISE